MRRVRCLSPLVHRIAGDAWVDARGSFLSAVAAGGVYRLLGAKDLCTTVFPPMLTEGDPWGNCVPPAREFEPAYSSLLFYSTVSVTVVLWVRLPLVPVRDGKLVIPIGLILPLSEAAEAQAAAEKGNAGKIP